MNLIQCFLILLFLPGAKANPTGSTIAILLEHRVLVVKQQNHLEEEILYFVNLHRQGKGLPVLQINEVESAVARQHSKNMASGLAPFGHQGMEARISKIKQQIGSISEAGENVAFGQMTAMEVVEQWLRSPAHKLNVEGNFTLTGIGYARDRKGNIYYTQLFTR